MSPENVEVVRRFFNATDRSLTAYWKEPRSLAAAIEAGDELPPEAAEALGYVHPDVDWRMAFAGLAFQGHLDMARGMEQLVEALEDYRIDVLEVADLGGDHVLATVQRILKGRHSQVEVIAPVFSLVTVREGLIVRMEEYSNRDEALAAER
jgi:ketosteroid isomerase-like protein